MGVRRTGLKRKRVQIQRYLSTQDAFGGVVRAFQDVGGERWAEVQPLAGLEKEQADQQKAIHKYRLYMRFFELGVEPDDRVLYDGRIFNITSVVNAGERDCDTIIDVTEVVTAE